MKIGHAEEDEAGLTVPSPGKTSRWRWSAKRRTQVGAGVLLAAIALGTGVAGATTTNASSPPKTGHGGPPAGMGRPTAVGKITALGSDAITITTQKKTTQSITYNSSTVFRTPGKTTTASALKTGQQIAVTGTKNSNGSVTATSVMIGGGPGKGGPGGPPGGGPGGSGAPGANGSAMPPKSPGAPPGQG